LETPVYHLEQVVKAKEEREDFNGPLDLILHLLSKNKMEIADIQIALILDQYLAWMDRRKKMDLEVASEFVAMASQLIFIKTRMLLNIHDEEAASELEQLQQVLEAHQRHENYLRIKSVTGSLHDRYLVGQDYMDKPPEPLPQQKEYRYVHQPEDLVKAMKAILARGDQKAVPQFQNFAGIVGREPYPVAGKAREVIRRLLHSGVTRFRALFQGSKSRSEVVATFLAVLELCKNKKIHLAGTDSECTVTCTDGDDNDLALSEEFQ
jgi:segregation and condensation protein A